LTGALWCLAAAVLALRAHEEQRGDDQYHPTVSAQPHRYSGPGRVGGHRFPDTLGVTGLQVGQVK